jgi:hypothetical protein
MVQKAMIGQVETEVRERALCYKVFILKDYTNPWDGKNLSSSSSLIIGEWESFELSPG